MLIRTHDHEIPKTKNSVKRFLNKFGDSFFTTAWISLKEADVKDHLMPEGRDPLWGRTDIFKNILNEIREENSCFDLKSLDINGQDIMTELDIKPGKTIGTVLDRLLEMVMDEKITNSHDELINAAKQIYRELNDAKSKDA
jgi:tRNA nucleotidyltransferase (CCA-adding enzyme)